MTASSRCPDHSTWVRLVNEQVQEPEGSLLHLHLEQCDACCAQVDALFGEWNAPQALNPEKPTLNASARMMLSGLAENPDRHAPTWAASVADLGPPAIPGLTGYVKVGQGGLGVVYRAQETSLNRDVAVKVLSGLGLAAPSSRLRAEREGLTLAKLRHPNVIQIYRTGETNGHPFLIMEWIPGGTLQAVIDQQVMPECRAAAVVRDLALAIGDAHALGIVHRDIKPDNILMMPAVAPGEPAIPKLADFGLARPFEGPPGLTSVGQIVGTPSYMAPEQTGLNPELGEVGPATDIHGLGATLYALLSGRPPYDGQTSRESLQLAARSEARPLAALYPGLSIDLKTITEKCLQHSPLERYRSAGELADDLTRFLNGEPIRARPVSSVERLEKWARRKPMAAVAVGLIIAGVMSGIAGIAYHQNQMMKKINDLNRAQTKERLDAQEIRVSVELSNAFRLQTQQTLSTLTDQAVELLSSQRPSSHQDKTLTLLRTLRDQFLAWPLDPGPENALVFKAAGLRRIAAAFIQTSQYEDAKVCLKGVLDLHGQAQQNTLVIPKLEQQHEQDEQELQDLIQKMK